MIIRMTTCLGMLVLLAAPAAAQDTNNTVHPALPMGWCCNDAYENTHVYYSSHTDPCDSPGIALTKLLDCRIKYWRGQVESLQKDIATYQASLANAKKRLREFEAAKKP